MREVTGKLHVKWHISTLENYCFWSRHFDRYVKYAPPYGENMRREYYATYMKSNSPGSPYINDEYNTVKGIYKI